MTRQLPNLINRTIVESSLFSLFAQALFIALVSFGGIAGVLIAFRPRFFFGLTGPLVCPPGSEMVMDQWNDGASNQFRLYCLDAMQQESADRTLLALAVVLGMFFLVSLYAALGGLLLLRAIRRRKYGVE